MDEVSPFEPTVVGAVVRHWRLVLAVAVAVVIPAGIFAVTRSAPYSATASLTVSDPRGPGVLAGAAPTEPDRYVSDQLVVFRSAPLGESAARRGLEQEPPLKQTPNWFLAHTSASAVAANNNVLSVTFKAPNSAEAMAGVRSVVAAYRDVVQTGIADQAKEVLAQLDSQIDSYRTQLAELQPTASNPASANKIQQLNDSLAPLVARRVQVAGEAKFPGNGIGQTLLPSHTSTQGKSAVLRVLVLALALGLILGVALAYFRSYRKRVFTHQRDPELLLGAPLLIDVSNLRTVDLLGLAPVEDAARVEEMAQELFAIAASLLVDQRSEDEGGLSLAVVSAQNAASCTAVAWRSALALAAQGLRVLLVDVEASWPPAGAWMARVTDHLAWKEGADGSVALGDPRPSTRRAGPFVGRLPPGETSASPGSKSALYLCSEAPPVRSQKDLKALFRDLEDDFDVVLVNAPPFLPSAVAAHLTSAAGNAVVVVPAGASVTDHEELVRRLRLAAATLIGYVYCCADCNVPNPQPGAAYRLRRAFRVEPKYPVLRQVSGGEGTGLTTGQP